MDVLNKAHGTQSGLMACDPGLRGSGIALFSEDGILRHAWYAKNPIRKGNGPESWFALANAVYTDVKQMAFRVDVFVLEVPQIYRVSRGDPNDLIDLAGVGAAIGASLPIQQAVCYKPREWKGTAPKEIHQPRIVAKLSEAEKYFLAATPKSLVHNVVDAVGIGLFYLKEIKVRT